MFELVNTSYYTPNAYFSMLVTLNSNVKYFEKLNKK